MPAQEHAFSEELPRLLYVDTDVIVAALVSTEPHYARCAAFFQRLAATATTQLYLSSLCWIECARAVTRESFRLRLHGNNRGACALTQEVNAERAARWLFTVAGASPRSTRCCCQATTSRLRQALTRSWP